MALVDDVKIKVIAGSGGNGGNSRHVNYGSGKTFADGGNGGHGGSVYFQASHNTSDLSEFRFKKVIKAFDGAKGMNKNLDGRKGEDVVVLVPPGTKIIDQNSNEVIEIENVEDPTLLAKGGRGGKGTHDYKLLSGSQVCEEGKPGEARSLHLILSIIAQIGLIGLPNAGKSSLLARLTNATPKIGSYPFTTIEPNLGSFGKIIIADIPGLIDGASTGRGLGTTFLKHIEKTKILFHCIDVTTEDVEETYKTVRKEFENYNTELLDKEETILLTKIDLSDEKQVKSQTKKLSKFKRKILPVSIYDETSLNALKSIISGL